jgi:hypothetical protein
LFVFGLVIFGDVVVTQPQAADPVKTAEAILNAWAPADGAETADA